MMVHDVKRHSAAAPKIAALNKSEPRYYSILPAAGRSERMGTSKLLLPWGDGTVIDSVLDAWTSSKTDVVVVVMRRDDSQLEQACRPYDVQIVKPESDPVDMKHSVQIGLQHLAATVRPNEHDRCFIAPSDVPMLDRNLIDDLIGARHRNETITVPRFGDKIGHPALLPWPLTRQIFDLAADQGIDRIVKRHAKTTVPFPAERLLRDIDTPDEYRQQLKRSQISNTPDRSETE